MKNQLFVYEFSLAVGLTQCENCLVWVGNMAQDTKGKLECCMQISVKKIYVLYIAFLVTVEAYISGKLLRKKYKSPSNKCQLSLVGIVSDIFSSFEKYKMR